MDTQSGSWKSFLESGTVAGVRLPVAASWNRALAAHVDESGRNLQRAAYDPEDRLLRAARNVLRGTEDALAGTTTWVAVANANGVITHEWSSTTRVHRRWTLAELEPGVSLSERSAGTNGVGMALATRTPSLVRGSEHFIEGWGDFVCAASPIHDPLTHELLGVVNISSLVDEENQHLRIALKALVSAVRMTLTSELQTDHRKLLHAHARARAVMSGSVVTFDRSRMIVEDDTGFSVPNRAELWHLVQRAGPLATEIRMPDGRILQIMRIDPADDSAGYSIAFTRQEPILDDDEADALSELSPIAAAEREVISSVLAEVHWNKAEAAARLQISRGTLYERIQRYRLVDPSGD